MHMHNAFIPQLFPILVALSLKSHRRIVTDWIRDILITYTNMYSTDVRH